MWGKPKKPQIKIIQTDELPYCPHCEKPLETILVNEKGFIFTNHIYMCGECKAMLSIGASNLV